jgi:hypothetical protein
MLGPQAEKLVKAHQAAEVLVSDLKDAHAVAGKCADTMILQDLLLDVVKVADRLKVLAKEAQREGSVFSPVEA